MNIDNAKKYLYEIIDDYKSSDSNEDKSDIFKSFCSSIWFCDNERKVYTKAVRFSVRKDLLDTDVGQVFDAWSEIDYKGYKSMSKETDWRNLIRQKINNIYTRYFDKDVILKKDYMSLLSTPKRLYYQWINGMDMDAHELTIIIDDALDNAEKLRMRYQKQKMELSWSDYKEVVEGFLQRCFNNCILIDDFENKTKLNMYDFMNEDNFYISYFCKSLEGELLKWQKQYYGVRDHQKYKHCKDCGRLIENDAKNRQYCSKCKKERRGKINHNYYIKTVLKS